MKEYESNSFNSAAALRVAGILLFVSCTCRGSIVFSAPTNGVYVGMASLSNVESCTSDSSTNINAIRFDDELAIMFLCKTGSVNLLVPINVEIFINFQMRDKAGKEVSKTSLGQQWGSQVENFPPRADKSNRNRMVSRVAAPWNGDRQSLPNGPRLPSPDNLFLMKESGIYDLTAEVHLMRQRMLANGWTWDHIVIPAVKMKVEKP